MDSSKAIEKLKTEGFSPILIGEGGEVTSQYPEMALNLRLDPSYY